MLRAAVVFCSLSLACAVRASWYWPFDGEDSSADMAAPRLSELMEPASKLIDAAADLAEDGKSQEAIEKYREALAALDAIERSDPERAQQPEFATLRNKRAYVNAAIDAMLMAQVRDNARAVAVTDTRELERRLAREKAGLPREPASEAQVTPPAAVAEPPKAEVAAPAAAVAPEMAAASAKLTPRARVAADLAAGDFDAADLGIRQMLAERATDPVALNLKAALEAARGDLAAAERALDKAIMTNPRDHYAYYNMVDLMLQKDPPDKTGARRYYESGRAMGGPEDAALEEALK